MRTLVPDVDFVSTADLVTSFTVVDRVTEGGRVTGTPPKGTGTVSRPED